MFRRASAGADPALIDLASNDYLALRSHPELSWRVAEAAQKYGVGSGSSRLVAGAGELAGKVEARFASLKGAQRAICMATGYMANLSTLTALASPGDLILHDKLNHASLFDASALAAQGVGGRGAVSVRTFAHGDVDRARRMALRHQERQPDTTVWLVSDSVFSMDGDLADVAALAALRDELNMNARTHTGGGCCLILDEAHATGVLGEQGAGLDEMCGHVADVCVSTASKALGSLGGIVTGRAEVIEAIENFARPFIYSTAPAPTQLAAIDAALDIVRDEPDRRHRLQALIRTVRAALAELGWDVRSADRDPTPIIPMLAGEPEEAVALSQRLRVAGVMAPAIRPPSVPRGACRVRLSLHAALTDNDVEKILDAARR